MTRHILELMVGITLLIAPISMSAQTSNGAASAHVIEMPLLDVIMWFERNSGLDVTSNNLTSDVVRDIAVSAEPDIFLRWLKQAHSVDSYQQGSSIFLSPLELSRQRMIPLTNLEALEVEQILNSYEISTTEDVAFGTTDGKAIVILTGPPEFIALTEGIIAETEQFRNPIPSRLINVIRGGSAQSSAAVLPRN